MPANDAPDLADYSLAAQHIIMYPHLSRVDRLFGGQLLSWIDEGAAMLAMKIMGTQRIVTKKLSEVIFESPAMLGDIMEIWCKPERYGRSSLGLSVLATVCRDAADDRSTTCRCDIVFVALDEHGKPCPWQRP